MILDFSGFSKLGFSDSSLRERDGFSWIVGLVLLDLDFGLIAINQLLPQK